MDDDAQSIIDIDEFALDREWHRQPKLVMKYALALADAKRILAERKADLDLCKADIWLAISDDPASYGLKKATEKVIEAAVLQQEDYQKALRRFNLARFRVDEIQAVLDSLEHKKKALENAVTLHLNNYTSQPRLKNAADREAMEEMSKESIRKRGKRKAQ